MNEVWVVMELSGYIDNEDNFNQRGSFPLGVFVTEEGARREVASMRATAINNGYTKRSGSLASPGQPSSAPDLYYTYWSAPMVEPALEALAEAAE